MLRFAATHSLSLNFFPKWLGGLERKVSLGAVQLLSQSMKECEEALAAGDVQFLLCHYHDAAPGLLDSRRFESLTVAIDRLAPVLAARCARTWRLPGEATAPLPVLAYAPESGLHRILAGTGVLQRSRLSTQTVFTSQMAVLLRTMALDGRGIAWLPVSLIEGDLESGALRHAGDASWEVPVQVRLFRERGQASGHGDQLWAGASQACAKGGRSPRRPARR